MPTTTDESWRFTDLRGFDPDAFVQNGHVQGSDPGTMLEIDVSGLATVDGSVEIERAPEGIRFEALDESHPQLGELVWVQEEPQNMGPWRAIRHRLEEALSEGVRLRYVGRPWRASPSEGYPTAHLREQDRIVREALSA